MSAISIRKRQRPSARDLFDRPPTPTLAIGHETSTELSNLVALGTLGAKTTDGREDREQYILQLEQLDAHNRILELSRGRLKLDLEGAGPMGGTSDTVYVFKSDNRFHGSIDERLRVEHLATSLWGPGKKTVLHAKAISFGRLSFRVDGQEARMVSTEDVYAVEFFSLKSAEIAESIVELHLNKFLMALDPPHGKPGLLVKARIGSTRWFVKHPTRYIDEQHWKMMSKQIPHLRPLPQSDVAPSSYKQSQQLNGLTNHLAFEVYPLPPSVTIQYLIKSLLDLKLLALPIQLKWTEESTSSNSIRILLKFDDRTSATICKLNLYKFGLRSPEKDPVQFLIDDGDSSIDDAWRIWRQPQTIVWEKQQIREFVASIKLEDQTDELEEEHEAEIKKQESDDEVAQFFESSDGSDDQFFNTQRNRHSKPKKRYRRRTYLQTLDDKKKRLEELVKRLTLECELDYINAQASNRSLQPSSEFQQISERVADEKKLERLMREVERRRILRRQIKNYRKTKRLPRKIRQQRKRWRQERSQQLANENNAGAADRSSGMESEDDSDSAAESESESESDSDESIERQLNPNSEENLKRIRQKRRIHELMYGDKTSSEPDDTHTPKKNIHER